MVHYFTDEQKEFIKENVKGRTRKELTSLVNEHFSLDLGINQVTAFIKNNRLNSGLDGRFKKNQEPWNKGIKGLDIGSKEHRFKKGQPAHNYKPVGYERLDSDGYVMVKISDNGNWPKRWKHKHKVVWEKANGPIPKGHVVIFGDGDKTNITLDNLILVSKKQLLALNRNNLIQNDVDLTRAGILIVDIQNKLIDRKRGF